MSRQPLRDDIIMTKSNLETLTDRQFEMVKLESAQAQEREALDRQHQFESRKEYSRMVFEAFLLYERNLKDYGQMALRSVFLLNGASILGLLTFIGAAVGKSVGSTTISPAMFVGAFSFFAVGLVLSAVAMTSAYFNYSGHRSITSDFGALANNMIRGGEKWPWGNTPARTRLVAWSYRTAVATGVLSLAMFSIGCWRVAAAFGRLP